MNHKNLKRAISITRLLPVLAISVSLLIATTVHAAAPGIQGTTFNLRAQSSFISQPDGSFVYSWGYGCASSTGITFKPGMPNNNCPGMQIPGPTLIVTEGQTITVNLTNNLPAAAGNTSILFPGFQVCVGTISAGVCTPSAPGTNGVTGLLAQEAAPGGSVSYSFVASSPGTRAYYSGTQGDLQVEMGLYGAIIVLPQNVPSACTSGVHSQNSAAQSHWNEGNFTLAAAAYDHPATCYDREYLFQFSEMDPKIHREAELQAKRNCTGCMQVATEPYVPAYYMINGRSMPDDMDPNYAYEYPHQPYNGNPHMHPGELVLLRIIGQGRWQHPFHEHGNHVRVLARDGNLILTPDGSGLAGPLLFTTTTTPGQAMDGIFYWTGRGLNWDAYGHNVDPAKSGHATCSPDTNGYYTTDPTAINYFEWCQDHNKPLQSTPLGDVAAGGPTTLPDPNIFADGPWFGGSPYLGPDATIRAVGFTGTIPPSGTVANPPTSEAGFAFMWHSHNEREITTNNSFPGGMLMMMLVDSREFVIDESN